MYASVTLIYLYSLSLCFLSCWRMRHLCAAILHVLSLQFNHVVDADTTTIHHLLSLAIFSPSRKSPAIHFSPLANPSSVTPPSTTCQLHSRTNTINHFPVLEEYLCTMLSVSILIYLSTYRGRPIPVNPSSSSCIVYSSVNTRLIIIIKFYNATLGAYSIFQSI